MYVQEQRETCYRSANGASKVRDMTEYLLISICNILDELRVPVSDELTFAGGAGSSSSIALATALAVESHGPGPGCGAGLGGLWDSGVVVDEADVVFACLAGWAISSKTALEGLLDEADEEPSLLAPALLGTPDLISSATSALAMDRPSKSPKKEVSVYLNSSVVWSRTLTSQARPRALSQWALVLASRGGGGEEPALVVGHELVDLDEAVSLGYPAGGYLAILDGVAADVFPGIVDGVGDGAAAQGRATDRCLVDVVALHGDLIILADHLKGPVVVPIAPGGEFRLAFDEVVG